MKYTISIDSNGGDGKTFLIKIWEELSKIEVKGDSVESLYVSKLLLKQIIESLEEVKEESPNGEDKGG